MSKINLRYMSLKEIAELEEDIVELRKLRQELRVYEVSFKLGFLQGTRGYGDGDIDKPEWFKQFLEEYTLQSLSETLQLRPPEGVCDCSVKELDPGEFPKVFSP